MIFNHQLPGATYMVFIHGTTQNMFILHLSPNVTHTMYIPLLPGQWEEVISFQISNLLSVSQLLP